MRVRFWGTRGSIATPGPGTNHFGGNTSCVEVTTSAGACFILDCGTGARALGGALMASSRGPLSVTILLSHTHWDHIQGFPFFAPLFVPGNRITVCGPEGCARSLREVLSGQMEFTYFPVEIGQLPATIAFKELGEGTHEMGGARILAQYLHHPAMTLGYRIEADGASVAYLCDHEPFAERLSHESAVAAGGTNPSRTRGTGVTRASWPVRAWWFMTRKYTPEEYPAKRNWGHSTYEYAVDLAGASQVRELALTHHDPGHDDDFRRGRRKARTRVREAARPSCESVLRLRRARCDRRAAWRRALADAPLTPQWDREALRGIRILVVDDDPDIRALARLALTQDGHQCGRSFQWQGSARVDGGTDAGSSRTGFADAGAGRAGGAQRPSVETRQRSRCPSSC